MKTVLAAVAYAATAAAVAPTVKLSYATYDGLPNGNVTSWRGMRYAAPPTGDLRFAAPQPPPVLEGVQSAKEPGNVCLGVGGGDAAGMGEDCLFVDLYAPTSATTSSKLPVFFWIQGGGYSYDYVPDVNGTHFIDASGGNVITVFLNYRVGPFGWLGGEQFAKGEQGTSLNNGLKDMIQALSWVQQNVAQFGGDPGHVTIGGSSAGGGAVTELLTAYGGQNATMNKLFHAGASESPFHPATFTPETSQFQFNDFADATGCGNSTNTIACLRALTAEQIQAKNVEYDLPGATGPPNYEYGPTAGTPEVPDFPFTLLMKGKFNKVPTIFGDDANGGSLFVPQSTNTEAELNTFLLNNYPNLTAADLTRINQLYTPANVPHIAPAGNASFGAYYNTAAKVYGDMTFECVAELASTSLSGAGQPAWQYLFNVTVPAETKAGLGAAHVSEQTAIFSTSGLAGYTFPAIINNYVAGYWQSFVRSYNPNTYRFPGSPTWEQWTGKNESWLEFNNGREGAENCGPDTLQIQRCQFLNSIGALLGQ